MGDGDQDDGMIRISVYGLLKEIKDAQTAGFAEVKVGLAGKADKADVARLESRLADHQTQLADHHDRLRDIESDRDDAVEQAESASKRRSITLASWQVWIALASVIAVCVIGIVAAEIESRSHPVVIHVVTTTAPLLKK